MSSVEMYDVEKDEWREMDELPRLRAGCVGFMVENENEIEAEESREFWVMGGYGGSMTVSGILLVDEYYKDAAVMKLKSNGGEKWRLVEDTWGEGKRPKIGKIVRYEKGFNHWQKETNVPKKAPYDKQVGLVAIKGELHVMILLDGYNLMDTRHTRHNIAMQDL